MIGSLYAAVSLSDAIGYLMFDIGEAANDLILIGHVIYGYSVLIRLCV